ncbi:CD109 antigen-like [Oratosquilla oratoria]|uniref:CD109 antigen-like n=1 Tax=Oratosquilla oratoria TaxID=337810 RepID=UPI003F76584C
MILKKYLTPCNGADITKSKDSRALDPEGHRASGSFCKRKFRLGLFMNLNIVFVLLVFLCLGGTPARSQEVDVQPPPLPSPSPHTSLLFGVEQPKEVRPIRKAYPDGEKVHARYLIVAGRTVIPGSVYRVSVYHIGNDEPLTVRASLLLDGKQVMAAKDVIKASDLTDILLQVSETSKGGQWQVVVEGREGKSQVVVFKRSANLNFSPRFLNIIIQPSRPVYNAGQKVRFRAILLNTELRPYAEPVDLFVLDPQDRIIRRWFSRQTGHGVINEEFTLPDYPLVGEWTIQVRALGQVANKKILVEHYFRPRFEVFVRMPHYFKTSDEFVSGVIIANMTNWRTVIGNCTVKLQMAQHPDHELPETFTDIYTEFTDKFTGVYDFNVPMSTLRSAFGGASLDNVTAKIEATVGDYFGWHVGSGWAMARLIREEVAVNFLGDQPIFLKPGMPLTVHLHVSYSDGHPVDTDLLLSSTLVLGARMTGASAGIDEVTIHGPTLAENEGVASVTFDIPDKVDNLKIDAKLQMKGGQLASATLLGVIHHSPNERHIQVETSTKDAAPGEFIVLHVRNNFFIRHFNYIVTAKGLLLYSAQEPVRDSNVPTVTTFSIPASTEMAPVVHVLVFVVAQDGQVVSDALAIPVNPLGQHEVGIRWNEHKDHSGGSVEMKMLGEAGAYFGVSAAWEEIHRMQAGHELTPTHVLLSMMDWGNTTLPLREAYTMSRRGDGSQIKFFATASSGPDTPSTFNFTDLVLLTDAALYFHPSQATDRAECGEGLLSCLTTGGCYKPYQRCDGRYQCNDRSDETGCPRQRDPLKDFRIHRLSRLHRFYDPDDGDWAWRHVTSVGAEIQVFPIPKRPQTWVVSMFAMGTESGLGIMEEKIQFDSAGPFMLTLEGPRVARQWEQVGLRVCVFNFHDKMVGVMVTLPHSDDYRFVHVEEKGNVKSYNPRTSSGDHQHIVWLEAGESRDVHLPIVFTRLGQVEVEVLGSTQMQKDSDSLVIDVQPEGVQIGKHTSILLDLKNRAIVYEFLDIHLDESPLIPYSLERRYIYDTPGGHISVTGDVVGPAFPEIPVGTSSLLGLEVMGAETAAYNFAANIWTLHYLRLTNQLEKQLLYNVLTSLNVEYASLVRYQDEDGSFSMWPGSEPSVWVTAYCIRTLWLATFEDWENLIYIDPAIVKNATAWLLDYQGPEGAFMETHHFLHPLDPKTDPRYRDGTRQQQYGNVTLTAEVVLTLVDVLEGLQGHLRKLANTAIIKASRFLERELSSLMDPYDVAVVAWALTKAESQDKDLAFDRLDVLKREEGSKIYWSREPIAFNPMTYEDSQRPFIQPKDDQKWDAHAVEATSYALLVYVERESIGIIHENIVRFLAVMRELDGGLISTLDSVVAMEALVKYSYRARLRDVTDMTVTIEHSANPNFSCEVHIDNSANLASMRSFELSNIWGHINVVGHGSGQALVQLDYTYSVDKEFLLDVPPVPAFDFTIKTSYSGRNNSRVHITTCSRWTNTEEAETSGLAVTEIHLPSGYYVMQDDLIELVQSGVVRNLRWALRTDTQVKFFFNFLDTEETCVSYEVERWHPVANHSRYNMARIYELYQPERFNNTIFEVTDLYDLDVCEVCGSYQCPYCPYYSTGPRMQASIAAITVMLIVVNSWNLIVK